MPKQSQNVMQKMMSRGRKKQKYDPDPTMTAQELRRLLNDWGLKKLSKSTKLELVALKQMHERAAFKKQKLIPATPEESKEEEEEEA